MFVKHLGPSPLKTSAKKIIGIFLKPRGVPLSKIAGYITIYGNTKSPPPPPQYQVLLLINFFKFHIHILSSPENEFILKSQQCSCEKFYKANIGYFIHFRIT